MLKILATIFLALAACTCVHAQQSIDVLALVHQRDFGSLEKHFNAIEAGFELGEITEFALLDAYKPLYLRNDVLSDDLAAWTSKYPKSYVAHLARGTYYRKLGELNRGTKSSREVPQSTMSYMEQVFDISDRELTTSLPLTKNPYLAVLNLLNIARYRSDAQASDRYLDEGNKLLPSNMLVRTRYLDHLKPRWGGSYLAMSAFVARCKNAGLNETDLDFLSAMINDDKGLTALEQGNVQEAAEMYKIALTNAEHSSSRLKSDYLDHSVNACRAGMVKNVQCP
jgi:tetratricopeptide (TPR) repeat protein